MIRVVLADDNSFITGGLEIILNVEPDIEVVATVANGKEAVQYCRDNKTIDIALLDVRMPILDGVEATKIITEETDISVVILTTFDDDDYILAAIQNGAKGYLLKNNDPKKIINALRSVMQGQSIIQAEIWDKIRTVNFTTTHPEKSVCLDDYGLSKREKDIITAIASGYSNKGIAKRLFISEGTVANNISTLLSKLELEHRTQLAIFYFTGKFGGGIDDDTL